VAEVLYWQRRHQRGLEAGRVARLLWFHRVRHEVRVFWASHVVHHFSEHYNLSTALRQTVSGLGAAV
jgi:hypothetical protein